MDYFIGDYYMERQLQKTSDCINRIEEVFSRLCSDYEEYEKCPDEDKALIANPMLHLAETIYMEAPEWAEDLARYLCILCDIKRLDVEINVK